MKTDMHSTQQHISSNALETANMEVSPLNQTLAQNLRELMEKRQWNQTQAAQRCGVAQTTISLYLNPERRKPGKDGKPGSAKLTEVEMLADAFGVAPWELLRPLTKPERRAYERIEAAFKDLKLMAQEQTTDYTIDVPTPSPVR